METLPAINIKEIQKVIGEAPQTLTANIASKERAVKAGDELIAAKNNVGMNADLDGKMSAYVDKCRKTVTSINEKRKPFTQMMDMLKKQFTECENLIEKKVNEIQGLRDDYATELMNKKREEERIAAQKLAREKEEIEIKQTIKTRVSAAFYQFVSDRKSGTQKYFDAITLEDFDTRKKVIEGSTPTFTVENLISLKVEAPKSEIISDVEVSSMLVEIIQNADLFESLKKEYSEIMEVFKKDMVDRFPSKKQQLEAMQAANEEEKQRLIELEKQRAEEAEKLMRAEAENKAKEAEANNKAEAAASTAQASMESLFTPSKEAPKVKESTEITVKNKAGYALIFQFWFEKEGKDLPDEKIERKTIAQMKKFCEDYAVSSGEIIESQFIEYKDKFKAK